MVIMVRDMQIHYNMPNRQEQIRSLIGAMKNKIELLTQQNANLTQENDKLNLENDKLMNILLMEQFEQTETSISEYQIPFQGQKSSNDQLKEE